MKKQKYIAIYSPLFQPVNSILIQIHNVSQFLFTFSQLWTPFNLLILNLMVTELIVSAYGIPIAAVASAQKGWKMGAIFCKASGFILTVLGELTLCSIAIKSLRLSPLIHYL